MVTKKGETKKLIVKSLLEKPKSINELACELCIKNATIRTHINKKQKLIKSLTILRIVKKIEEKILIRGGYAKTKIYGIVDKEKANKFLEK